MYPFAKPSLSSFSHLFFLRKVGFAATGSVGERASVSPHVNVGLNAPTSSDVRRPPFLPLCV